MAHTTITVRTSTRALLERVRRENESLGDTIERYVFEPAATCGELLEKLKPFKGKGVLTPEGRRAVREGRGRRSPRK